LKLVRSVIVAAVVVALMLLGCRLVAAQYQPEQYVGGGGGGMIRGTVLGFNMYDQLEPVIWATVNANNGHRSFLAYTGSGGFYEMFVPVGTYNVTVIEPGYLGYSSSVVVSDGSTSSINFYLEQSHVPVPEFQPNVTLIVMVLTLAGTLVIRRRSTKRSR
jgi:hypothetical protein